MRSDDRHLINLNYGSCREYMLAIVCAQSPIANFIFLLVTNYTSIHAIDGFCLFRFELILHMK